MYYAYKAYHTGTTERFEVAEKRMSLQELSDATGIPSSILGNYEKDENVDISLGNLLTLADFYHVSTDYLLCRTELRKHTNKSVSDLHLNDDAVQILTDEKYNPRLLSELLSHENFHKFMTDLEIYIDGFNDKGIQIANAFLDVMRYKLNELGGDSTDVFTKKFDTSHIETEQYYINILLEDLKPIVSDLRNTHMKDSNTASDIDYQSMVKNIIDDFTSPTQIATEDTSEASNDAYINGLLLLLLLHPHPAFLQSQNRCCPHQSHRCLCNYTDFRKYNDRTLCQEHNF